MRGMEEALAYALKTGLITKNTDTRAAVYNPHTGLPGYDLVSHDAKISAYGASRTASGPYDLIVVYGTKQAEETRGLVADAVASLAPMGRLAVIQPNAQGAAGLEKHLRAIAPAMTVTSKAKARIMCMARGEITDDAMRAQWLAQAAMQPVLDGTYISCPGLFSWNRADAGSAMLLECLPPLKGTGADFGCGWGYLTRALGGDKVYAVDIDARAIAAVAHNAPAATGIWADATRPVDGLPPLDWIVSNPPFHGLAGEDRRLGQFFIANAAHHLKKGGALYLVANRHLPYEKILAEHFGAVRVLADKGGYKVIAAVR